MRLLSLFAFLFVSTVTGASTVTIDFEEDPTYSDGDIYSKGYRFSGYSEVNTYPLEYGDAYIASPSGSNSGTRAVAASAEATTCDSGSCNAAFITMSKEDGGSFAVHSWGLYTEGTFGAPIRGRTSNGDSVILDTPPGTGAWLNLTEVRVGYSNSSYNYQNIYVEMDNIVVSAPVTVAIDVAPTSAANEILTASDQPIVVGVLSTNVGDGDAVDFDALQVSPESLKFGPGEAPNVAVSPWPVDIGNDGDTDLLFVFKTEASGILCGDTEVSLSGETYSGEPFTATDVVATTDCEDLGCHP